MDNLILRPVSSRETKQGRKYVELVDDFLSNAEPGDAVEVLGEGNEPLDRDEMERVYNGLRQLLKYRKKRGTPLPITLGKSTRDGVFRVFVRREDSHE